MTSPVTRQYFPVTAEHFKLANIESRVLVRNGDQHDWKRYWMLPEGYFCPIGKLNIVCVTTISGGPHGNIVIHSFMEKQPND